MLRIILTITLIGSLLVSYGQDKNTAKDKSSKFSIGGQLYLGESAIYGRRRSYLGGWHGINYAFGPVAQYRISDSSRLSLSFGLLWERPFVRDDRGIICDPISCPQELQKDNYMYVPMIAEYAIVKSKNGSYGLDFGLGIVSYVFLWGKVEEMMYKDGVYGLYLTQKYNIFNDPESSFRRPVFINYALSMTNDFPLGNHRFKLGVQAQFYSRPEKVLRFNGLELTFGFLF